MALQLIITNAGRAALVAAGGTNAVQIAQCGISGTAVVPAATMTALPGEVKRVATIAGQAVGPDVIHLVVRDETADVYTLRSFGLYLADGTLFAVFGQAAPVLEKASASLMLLAVDVTFVDIAASLVTFGSTNFLNPPATQTTPGVVRLATNAETAAGIDATKALTPANIATILSAAAILAKLVTVDGAGSGLDADLLDGQQGAWYSDIAGRLGYTPLNQASYTAADVRTKLLTVDGSGSGVDADLLDGQDGAWYADVASRLGFTPVRQGGGAGQTNSIVQIGWDGGFRLKAQVDALDLGNIVFEPSASNVWRSTNDGAGSGLDADLLDGQDGAYYTNITARLGYTPLNSTSYTAADVLAKLLTVDGAGSGLDADVLDGQQGAWYADIASRLGFTPLNATSYTAADVKTKLLTVDGAGSGLDADLLDGQDGAYYTAIAARLGFTPLNATSYTAADVKTKLLTVDGAGSGLDADLLDGQDGTYYTAIAARLGYTPVRQGAGPGQFGSTISVGWDGNFRLKASVDGADLGNLVFDSNVADVWRASNDGAGSGLDADLLDGFQGAAYDRVIESSLAQSGYRKYADGTIDCWGVTAVPANSTTFIAVPVAHTQYIVPTGSSARATDSQASCGVREVVGSPPSGFNVKNNNTESVTFWWHTRGK